MISTRGRYALRFMIDLAEYGEKGQVTVKTVSRRQGISPKYLEQILPILTKNRLVEASHGKGGGYRLTREPKDYTAGEILRLTEGSLAPVACLGCDAPECDRSIDCKTLPMWKRFDEITKDFFDGITIKDLIDGSYN